MNKPTSVYLQWYGDATDEERNYIDEVGNGDTSEITWCADKINNFDLGPFVLDLNGQVEMLKAQLAKSIDREVELNKELEQVKAELESLHQIGSIKIVR